MGEHPVDSPRAAVVTVSDRSAAGTRPDASGPVAVQALIDAGFHCDPAIVVPDGEDSVESALRHALRRGIRLVVTTGGTGIAPRDRTPEGTARVLTRPLPGIAETVRRIGAEQKPAGMLSRALAGIVDAGTDSPRGALVVNLPGSPAAVADGMPVVLSVARHVLDQLGGSDHA